MKQLKNLSIIALFLFVVCDPVFAQALGGLAKAQSTMATIKTGVYAVVGVLSGIYLLWLGAMAFFEKKQWSDFAWGVLYVALVGGSIALADFAWSLFA